MKKTLSLIVASILLISVFAGCAPKKPSTENNIVLAGIYSQGDSPWYFYESQVSSKVAKELGAKDYLIYDSKKSPDAFIKALDDSISKHVSGILINIPDQKLSTIAVNKCNAAKIPVIAVDIPLIDNMGKQLVPFVGYDKGNAGEQVADWVVNYVNTKKFITPATGVIFLTTNKYPDCIPISQGLQKEWNAKMASFPKNHIFISDYNGETDKAENAVTSLVSTNKDIKKWIVMAPNDNGGYGSARALEKAKLDKNSIVTGFDASYAKLEFKKPYSCFVASGFVDYNDVGRVAAEDMYYYLTSKKAFKQNDFVKAYVVSKDNYKDVMKDQAN